jgi:hypothetical protein
MQAPEFSDLGSTEVTLLRAELSRLERQPEIANSIRIRQLLRYLFEETVMGRADGISQYTIAFECLGQSTEFDTAVNTLVRSHAHRLRKVLKELAPPEGETRIVMSDRGYGLVFEVASARLSDIEIKFERATVGIIRPTFREEIEIDSSFATQLAHSLIEAMVGESDLFSPYSLLDEQTVDPAAILTQDDGPDFLLAGELLRLSGKPHLHLRLTETSGGSCLWTTRVECDPTTIQQQKMQGLANHLISQISSDWGVICSHVAKQARRKNSENYEPHEAVAVARQYLTHFHYEHLERCVRSLRHASEVEEASVPATLAVVLSMACAVEPRWKEPLDRSEIRRLAARAGRLDPESGWTRLALGVSAMIDGRRAELAEMAKRAQREDDTPTMLLGAFGSLLCFQAIEIELGRKMIDRFISGMTGYPRLVHLALAQCALGEGDTITARMELANYGVPWGWASPLVAAGCSAIEGDAVAARADWQRVLDSFPEFSQRWRETVATQWDVSHLEAIFQSLETHGIKTGCLAMQ